MAKLVGTRITTNASTGGYRPPYPAEKSMHHFVTRVLLPMTSLLAVAPAFASDQTQEGYYLSAKLLNAQQQAHNMDLSLRPGIGSFVAGKASDDALGGAIAAGYRFGNGWRAEGEYTFRRDAEFTSGSTTFPTSLNHDRIHARRVMLNAYRDFALGNGFSLYATAGIGVASVQSGGWQGNPARQFASNTQNNLAYAIGAGVSYAPSEQWNVDLGYRYTDMGQAQSGFNTFTNARGLQDEQMKANIIVNEVYLGIRFNL
jgi:opacity protein-like surface antigen